MTSGSARKKARIAAEDAAGNPLARAAFDLFLDVYAAEAGNLALRTLARGGVFLAGGIAGRRGGRWVRSMPWWDVRLRSAPRRSG